MGYNNDDALEDLARLESAREIHDEVEGTDLRVDILVNNAAAGVMPGHFDETNLEYIDDQIQINVVTLTHLTRLFSAPMVEHGAGRILNVSSTAGEFPDSVFGVYAATKGYVSTLSNVLAEQLEPVGITVTVLVSGMDGYGHGLGSLPSVGYRPRVQRNSVAGGSGQSGVQRSSERPNTRHSGPDVSRGTEERIHNESIGH